MGLTVKQVDRLTKPGRYRDEKNLFLQITQAGVKSWLLRYVSPVTGRERWMGLGSADDVDLDLARKDAHEARLQIRGGVDPLEAKRADHALKTAKGKLPTFEEACRTYHQQNEGRWRNEKSRKQWLSKMERFAFPIIGRVSIADVDTALVLRVLEQPYQGQALWLALASAARLRQGIEQVLSWAKVRGYRTGDNPATLELLQHALPIRPKPTNGGNHHPALPWTQIGEFMAELRTRTGVAAMAVEFCILTAARIEEILGMRRDEVDFANRTWTVPAGRMKGEREHKVPLSTRAIEILEQVPTEADNPFQFVGSRNEGLGNSALAAIVSRMNAARTKAGLARYIDPKQGGRDIVPHGFRSTFRDWVGEATNFPEALGEAALAHINGDKVEGAYKRGTMYEKRREVMETWAQYCAGADAANSARCA